MLITVWGQVKPPPQVHALNFLLLFFISSLTLSKYFHLKTCTYCGTFVEFYSTNLINS